MASEELKNTRCKYKTWGKYTEQTVRQSRTNKNHRIIRKGDQEIEFHKDEIDSLVVTLIEMRSCK